MGDNTQYRNNNIQYTSLEYLYHVMSIQPINALRQGAEEAHLFWPKLVFPNP